MHIFNNMNICYSDLPYLLLRKKFLNLIIIYVCGIDIKTILMLKIILELGSG